MKMLTFTILIKFVFFLVLTYIVAIPTLYAEKNKSQTFNSMTTQDILISKHKNFYSIALINGAHNGEFELVKKLYNKDIDLTITNEHGYNILTAALSSLYKNKIKKIVTFLLDSGFPINARSGGVSNVLHIAISNKQIDLAFILVEKGADLDAVDNYGYTIVDKLEHYLDPKSKYRQLAKIIQKKLSPRQIKVFKQLKLRPKSINKTAYIADKDAQLNIPVLRPVQMLKIHQPYSTINSLAISLDGKTIASSDSRKQQLFVWDFQTKKVLWSTTGITEPFKSLQFSPDQTKLISGSRDHIARIWDVKSGKVILKLEGHKKPVLAVSYMPDGKSVITASDDYTMRRWNLVTGKTSMLYTGNDATINTIDVSPDGMWILSYGSSLRIWNVATGMTEKYFFNMPSNTSVARFSPDGNIIAHDSDGGVTYMFEDGTTLKANSGFSLIHSKSVKLLQSVGGHSSRVNDLSFSSTGELIASASSDGTVQVYNIKLQRAIVILKPDYNIQPYLDSMHSVAFLPDNIHILAGSDRGFIYVWDIKSAIKLNAQPSKISSVDKLDK